VFRWLAQLMRGLAPKSVLHSSSDGELIYELPYGPGCSFWVIQGYGGSYSHTEDSHFSIDFGMPEGTPVCAARGGIVYRVIDQFTEGGTDPSFKPKANAIYVLHADDTIAAYVHLMRGGMCVRAGDPVTIGQTIGYSGNTGWSGTPHLHFHVADASLHKRRATKFNTFENGSTIVEVHRKYTRPTPQRKHERNDVRVRPTDVPDISHERDAFAFCPELLNQAENLAAELASAGYEVMSDYSSIDVMHDVHGLEVCGIHSPDVALEITRLLLSRFPGWNAGWLHAPDSASTQKWVASIQRDRDLVLEYWDTD
jgi:murein DD-endopeptidase MepM/ murein hydrolase activator NlpD